LSPAYKASRRRRAFKRFEHFQERERENKRTAIFAESGIADVLRPEMISSGLIFIGALIVRTQALKGQDFPIPHEDLYEDFKIKVDKECWIAKNSTRAEWKNCMDNNELTVDYTCRFSLFGYKCFCCGAFFHYIENGKICTKYCLTNKQREFCQAGLVVLPNNFGDPIPEKVTLDDAGLRRGPLGKIRRGKETEVNVTNFEASDKCSSNPLEFDPELGPAKLVTKKEWDDSRWGSKTTVRPEDQGPKSGDPRPRLPHTDPKKEWNDIVWSSETKEGHNPQIPAPTTIKTPSKNHLGDAHSFGGGGSIREQVPLEDTVTESATTTKPIVPKDRFGQEGHAWGGTQTKQETSVERHTDKRVSIENRQEANVQRTTRKSRPSKVQRTERPNVQFGIGSNDFALVDSGGAKLELDPVATNAPKSSTTTTTTTDAEDERPNWGQQASSSSRPRAEESNAGSSGSTNNRQNEKPNWG